LIENNRNLILFLKLMDLRRNCGDLRGWRYEGRILPGAKNDDENGEHFKW
jgi:hypothetical protein